MTHDDPRQTAGGPQDRDSCQHGGKTRTTEQTHCHHPPMCTILRRVTQHYLRRGASEPPKQPIFAPRPQTRNLQVLCRPNAPEIRPNPIFSVTAMPRPVEFADHHPDSVLSPRHMVSWSRAPRCDIFAVA